MKNLMVVIDDIKKELKGNKAVIQQDIDFLCRQISTDTQNIGARMNEFEIKCGDFDIIINEKLFDDVVTSQFVLFGKVTNSVHNSQDSLKVFKDFF